MLPLPAPRIHRNVSGASLTGRPDSARLLDTAQTRFTDRLLNRQTARTGQGLSPAPSLRHDKGPAPQPPEGKQPWTPPPGVLRTPSVNEAGPNSSGRLARGEEDVRPLLRPGHASETPIVRAPHALGGALPMHLADPPSTRYQRVKQRLANAVPLPLRRVWRAIDAAVRRLIDRLRP